MFETIVVGVDGREGGRDALRLGEALALMGAHRLVAARVYPYAYPLRGAPPLPDVVSEQSIRDSLEREVAAADLDAETMVIGDSSPAGGLHRAAEHVDADVIVVGSTHHGALGRALVGDDVLATIHGSPCAVAVAPRRAGLGQRGPARIGVGYDGGPESRRALALAADVAEATGAGLEILSAVVPPPAMPGATTEEPRYTRRREHAEAMLREAVEALAVDAAAEVVDGDADEALKDLSQRVDLLVLGSRGFGPVRRLLAGSTSASVIRGAGCAVVVMPRGAAAGGPGLPLAAGGPAARSPA